MCLFEISCYGYFQALRKSFFHLPHNGHKPFIAEVAFFNEYFHVIKTIAQFGSLVSIMICEVFVSKCCKKCLFAAFPISLKVFAKFFEKLFLRRLPNIPHINIVSARMDVAGLTANFGNINRQVFWERDDTRPEKTIHNYRICQNVRIRPSDL